MTSTPGYILVDYTTFPDQILIAISTGPGPKGRLCNSMHMFGTHPTSKRWVSDALGLCLFPSIFGQQVADTGIYPADWTSSSAYRLGHARTFMSLMPVQTQFEINDADASGCRITRCAYKCFELTHRNMCIEYTFGDGCRHIIIGHDGIFRTIKLGHGSNPEAVATDFIIGGLAVSATIHGTKYFVSLTDDKLTVVNRTALKSTIYNLGPALVMLFRLMFVRTIITE